MIALVLAWAWPYLQQCRQYSKTFHYPEYQALGYKGRGRWRHTWNGKKTKLKANTIDNDINPKFDGKLLFAGYTNLCIHMI